MRHTGTRWTRWALALGLWSAASAPGAGSLGQVTAVSVAALNLYGTPDAEQPARTLPREQVPLPLDVHDIAPTKRLKIKLGAAWFWIDRGVVRTKGVQSAPTCGQEAKAAPTPSVLAPRGLGQGCR